jgi:hypothetical protein
MESGNYGPDNHLRPDYDSRREGDEEIFDAFNQCDMKHSNCEHNGIEISEKAKLKLAETRLHLEYAHEAWNAFHDLLEAGVPKKRECLNDPMVCGMECCSEEIPQRDAGGHDA